VWFENKIVMARSASKGASTEGQTTAHFKVSMYRSAMQPPPIVSLGDWQRQRWQTYVSGFDPCGLQAPEPP